ncbi:TPA: hypothetical protein ACIAEA_003423 [Escherichia coli]
MISLSPPTICNSANGLMSLPDKRQIAIGEKIELTNNAQFVLSKEEGGRLVVVQLVEN